MIQAIVFLPLIGAVVMSVVVMLNGVAARIARMRPEDGNQAGQDRSQQRQKDNCLNHNCP